MKNSYDDDDASSAPDAASCAASLSSFSQDTASLYSHEAAEVSLYSQIAQVEPSPYVSAEPVTQPEPETGVEMPLCNPADLETLLEAVDEMETRVEFRNIEVVSPGSTTPRSGAERWSDAISLPGHADDVETVTSDTEPALPHTSGGPPSEMYYTASSEVSLLSDTELPERTQLEDSMEGRTDRKECVIAGHVAAMRERFESMTRTSTPCPDLVRSLSPSLEVFRNKSPSPDRLA